MKTIIYICIFFSFLFFQNISPAFNQIVLTLQPGSEEGIDAPVTSIYPDQNWGDNSSFVAVAWTFGGEFGIDRSLMKFDLTQIYPSAIILDARLSLFYWQGECTGHAGENASYLQKVIENWDEMSVTWNNQPSTTTSGEIYLPMSYSQTQDYPDIDITQFVKDWVVDPQHNFGMLFRIADESIYRSMLFGSSDNTNASLRPKLVITYLPCPQPVAHFTYAIVEPVVQFNDSSSSASSWYWDFGDGYFSDLKNPVHNYSQFGKYYTCLSVTDSCGSGQYCDTVYFCRPPDPGFSYSVNGHFVSFTDSSFSPSRWYWSFGDDFFSDLQNPTHYYQNPGTYYVCLTSANVCNQQTFCDSATIQASGVETINGEKISIYPVPATDHLSIDWVNPKPGSGEISIINPGGITEFKKGVSITSTDYHDKTDLKKLPSGIYYLKIMTGNKIVMQRFVVLR